MEEQAEAGEEEAEALGQDAPKESFMPIACASFAPPFRPR